MSIEDGIRIDAYGSGQDHPPVSGPEVKNQVASFGKVGKHSNVVPTLNLSLNNEQSVVMSTDQHTTSINAVQSPSSHTLSTHSHAPFNSHLDKRRLKQPVPIMYHLRIHLRQPDLFPTPRNHLTLIRTNATFQTFLTGLYSSKGCDIFGRVRDGVVEALTSVCKKKIVSKPLPQRYT